MDHRLSEQQLIHKFLQNLEELPDVRANFHLERSGSQGAHIDLKVAGKPLRLLIEAKKIAYPRDVQQAIWQLRRASREQNFDKRTILVLIAEYISPGAKQLLEAEQVGYYDRGGSLYLPAPGAYFYIDKPPAKVFERSVRSLFPAGVLKFSTHFLSIITVGLEFTNWHSLLWCHRLPHLKCSQNWSAWIGWHPGDRDLENSANCASRPALLNAWAKNVKDSPSPTMARYYVPDSKVDGLLGSIGEKFGKSNTEYAVSYEAAAQRYAPFLSSISQVHVRMLKTPESQAAISELGGRAVTEGSNLAIIDAGSQGELLFRNRLDNIWLASPVQVYLDLLHGEGRSAEMAEHLRKERIGF